MDVVNVVVGREMRSGLNVFSAGEAVPTQTTPRDQGEGPERG